MINDENYDAILDRIESAREGESISDLDIKEYIANKKTGGLSDKQNELGDRLFREHMKRFDAKIEQKLNERKTIIVEVPQKHIKYQKSYNSWKNHPEQEQFIRERLKNKTTKEIIYEYNSRFSPISQERSESSVKTKIYRLKKS